MRRADVVPLDDLSPADWLREQLVGFEGRVADVVPARYEAFARVLHRHDQGLGDSGRWSEVAAYCGTTLHPLAQFRMLAGLDGRSVATRVWEEPEPHEGSLDRVTLAALRDALRPCTTTPGRCWFALWEGYGGQPVAWRAAPTFELPGRGYHLFAGALADVVEVSEEFQYAGLEDEHPTTVWLRLSSGASTPQVPEEVVARFRAHGPPQSPNLWWPDDRAWCVASEIDLDSTLVAGTAALVAELTGHPDLEAFEVAPGDALTYDADTVNMR